MEALLDGKRDHYPYRPSAIVVFTITVQIVAINTFQVDGFLQQFHLVIRYKKGIYNKVTDMLSRSIVNSTIILKHNPIMHEIFIEQYVNDSDFQDVHEILSHGNQNEEL